MDIDVLPRLGIQTDDRETIEIVAVITKFLNYRNETTVPNIPRHGNKFSCNDLNFMALTASRICETRENAANLYAYVCPISRDICRRENENSMRIRSKITTLRRKHCLALRYIVENCQRAVKSASYKQLRCTIDTARWYKKNI